MNMDEELTTEEQQALDMIDLDESSKYGYPQVEDKQNIYAFFKRVMGMKDNTKTANLTEEELGLAKIPVRTNQELDLYCRKMGMKGFASYFKEEAQILLGTSLSREGFLDKLAVTQKRESEFKTKTQKPNKGWFQKKKQPELGGM